MRRATEPRCPCGGPAYATCCGPWHRGEAEAPTPEALMRSRYAAFARGDVDYLVKTLHPDHADRADGDAALRSSLADTVRTLRYGGLRVLDARPAGPDGLAQVLFHARIHEGGAARSFVERSWFAHDGAGWRYLAGDLLPAPGAAPAALRIEAFERVLAGRSP